MPDTNIAPASRKPTARSKVLPVLDNFERAMKEVPEGQEGSEWIAGIAQIHKQFKDVLGKQRVAEIPTEGQKFDPNLHEALMQGPGEKDMIVEEMEKGYMMGERVLRPAKVKVGDGS